MALELVLFSCLNIIVYTLYMTIFSMIFSIHLFIPINLLMFPLASWQLKKLWWVCMQVGMMITILLEYHGHCVVVQSHHPTSWSRSLEWKTQLWLASLSCVEHLNYRRCLDDTWNRVTCDTVVIFIFIGLNFHGFVKK